MTAEVIDASLTDMIRVMEGIADPVGKAAVNLDCVVHLAWKAQHRPVTHDIIAVASDHLRQAIATLVEVHDNLRRAEQNLREIANGGKGSGA